jgi:ankyrin repeat protein
MISGTWYGTILHSACYENDLESLQSLLASGKEDLDFDINMRNTQGWTALHAAVYLNRIEAVRLLINEGADVMLVTDEEGRHTALHIACSRGHREIVVLLMNADDHGRKNKK